ncbi:MAG: GGDEF domain-containing protein [Vibrio sp.]
MPSFKVIILLILLLVAFHNQADEMGSYKEQTYTVAALSEDVGNHIVFDELVKNFNFNVKYVYYDDISQVINAIKTEKADFSANITYSDSRTEHINISPPTNIEYTYLFTLPHFSEFTSLEDIETIGISHNIIFKQLIKNIYPDMNVVEFSDFNEAKNLLLNRQVDGIVGTIEQLKHFLNDGFDAQLLNGKLPIQPVGIAATKNKYQDQLADMVDYLRSGKAQKNLLKKMEDYQFEVRKNALRNRVVRLGIDSKIPIKIKLENVYQFSEYMENGEIKGVSYDILKEACAILGLNCQIVSHATETWTEMFNDLLNQKIDILGPITISNTRREVMNFSQPYFQTEAVLVKRTGYKEGVYKTLAEMVAEKISVIEGDYYDQLLSKMLPSKMLYKKHSRRLQMEALLKGEIDYIVLNRQNYNKMLSDHDADFSTEEDKSIGVFHRAQLSFGFPNTEKGKKLSVLFSLAESLIDIPAIVRKYYVSPDWRLTILKEKKLNKIIQYIYVISFLIMIIVIYYIHKQSMTDKLTKLKNRRALYRKYKSGVPQWHTFIYIDINDFKIINDSYGHQVGDDVLQQLSHIIRLNWQGSSFRLGGDEFILTINRDLDNFVEVLKIFEEFEVLLENEKKINVHTSCGISTNRKKLMQLDEVLHLADKKMYVKKALKKASRIC